MCKAMNRSLTNVIFGGFELDPSAVQQTKITSPHIEINTEAAVEMMVNSKSVIIVPGYGLAVAKAQYPVAELVKQLMQNGVSVK
jgi:NAD(P) transhydrogenase